MNRSILIIDDSENISIRLKEFLNKLGYSDIHFTKDTSSSIIKLKFL